MSRYKVVFLLLLIVFSLIVLSADVYAEPQYIPFPPYHVEPVNNVLYPRLAAPLFTKPGSMISVYVSGVVDVSNMEAFDDVRGNRFPLDINSVWRFTDDRDGAVITDITVIDVYVPDDAVPGLYDLVVSTNDGVYREPNALVIVDEFPDVYVIGHISDTHLGGWGGKYIAPYENFDKAIYSMEALGVDIVACSGDFIEQTKEEGIKHVIDILSKSTIPFTVAPGNTDYFFNDKGLFLIEKYFGPDSSVVDMGKGIIVNIDAETGDIAEEVVYDWINSTLYHYRDLNLKILNSHYPNWDNTVVSQAFIDFFRAMNERYGISLFLNGHIHRNTKKVSETTGILTITTTSTEVSSEFLGFRLIYAHSDGSIEAFDNMIYNLEQFYVDYSQDNFFTSTGQTAVVYNGLGSEVGLTLLFKMRDTGEALYLNGSPIGEGVYEFSDDGSKFKTLELEVTVKPGERRVFVVSQGVDESPPTIDVEVKSFKQYYYFKASVSDEGTGVAVTMYYYSLDNSTWNECDYIIIDSWPYPSVPKEYESFFYKIVLADYAGNSRVVYGVYGEPSVGGPGGEGGPQIPDTTYAIIGVIIVAVVAVGVYLFRFRKH